MCSPDLFLAGFDIFDHFLHLRQEMAIKGGTINSFLGVMNQTLMSASTSSLGIVFFKLLREFVE